MHVHLDITLECNRTIQPKTDRVFFESCTVKFKRIGEIQFGFNVSEASVNGSEINFYLKEYDFNSFPESFALPLILKTDSIELIKEVFVSVLDINDTLTVNNVKNMTFIVYEDSCDTLYIDVPQDLCLSAAIDMDGV